MLKTSFFNISSKKLALSAKIRIVQLSDLHRKKFGDSNSILINRVKELSPDYIFITGDMISRNVTDLSDIQHLIDELLKTAPVYYSLGNHEKDLEKLDPNLYSELISSIENKCILLDNRRAEIITENKKIEIIGLTVFSECYKNNGSYKNLRKLETKDILSLTGEKSENFSILLAHNPMFFDSYAEYGAELVLSGHVHGGCVRLPFFGAVLSPERKLFPKYSKGLYRKSGTEMIVSAGLGKFRMFNPPEIIVIDIQ